MQRIAGEDRVPLADRVYEAVKSEVVSLELPPGTLLSEKELADRFQVSRTPVREALRRLEQDGLVTIIARKGAFIPELSFRDVLEIDEIRLLLEGAAARVAASKIGADELNGIEAALNQLNPIAPDDKDCQAILQVDRCLHSAIMSATGNRWMRDIVIRVYNIIYTIRRTTTETRYQETLAELRAIISALRARDPDAAQKAIQEHISLAKLDVHDFR